MRKVYFLKSLELKIIAFLTLLGIIFLFTYYFFFNTFDHISANHTLYQIIKSQLELEHSTQALVAGGNLQESLLEESDNFEVSIRKFDELLLILIEGGEYQSGSVNVKVSSSALKPYKKELVTLKDRWENLSYQLNKFQTTIRTYQEHLNQQISQSNGKWLSNLVELEIQGWMGEEIFQSEREVIKSIKVQAKEVRHLLYTWNYLASQSSADLEQKKVDEYKKNACFRLWETKKIFVALEKRNPYRFCCSKNCISK